MAERPWQTQLRSLRHHVDRIRTFVESEKADKFRVGEATIHIVNSEPQGALQIEGRVTCGLNDDVIGFRPDYRNSALATERYKRKSRGPQPGISGQSLR
jgi:hypothetical protein